MTISNVLLFVIPFLIAAGLPGPAQVTLVAKVMARGRASALPFISGMVVGNAIWLVATILGLASVALRYEAFFNIIKWIGVIYLLFIAWKLWTAPTTFQAEDVQKPGGFFAGMTLTLGNPKAVIFFGAILPQAFDLTTLSHAQAASIVMLGVAIDFGVQCCYLVAATNARRLISTPNGLRAVNRGAAAVILGCAALVARRT